MTRRRAAWSAVRRRPTFGGSVGAVVFWYESLVPSLLPRSWPVQAAISAICLAIGYGLGTLVHAIVRRVPRVRRLDLDPQIGRRAWLVLAAVAAVALVAGAVQWAGWQNTQRDLVTLEHISAITIVPVIVLTVILSAVLLAGGRLVGGAIRRVDRFTNRHLPPRLASPATIVLVLVVGSFLLQDVAFEQFTSWANTSFGTVDDGTKEGTVRPTSPYVSGGEGSLVAWDTLGYQGREFVAHATSTKRMRAFLGDDAPVKPPIRAYVGLKSADSFEAEADLAVRELVRTGAFDRKVLVVASATGTGWIDPDASESIEMMYGGDTAIVSMQYSFLPSWISFITDLDKAADAGSLLYDAVHRHWASLPADQRPKLIVFGLSLGSYGAESAFAGLDARSSIANLAARSDGAMFVGPTDGNPIHRQLTADRAPTSPAWLPVVDEGRTVRFVNRGPDGRDLPDDWDAPRVLVIQHPTDPVTFWGFHVFATQPEWMDEPRGHDVTPDASWFPIVTGVQGVFDLMAGFSAPPGYGHDYRLDYVDGWARVVPPDSWTDTDSTELEQFLHGR